MSFQSISRRPYYSTPFNKTDKLWIKTCVLIPFVTDFSVLSVRMFRTPIHNNQQTLILIFSAPISTKSSNRLVGLDIGTQLVNESYCDEKSHGNCCHCVHSNKEVNMATEEYQKANHTRSSSSQEKMDANDIAIPIDLEDVNLTLSCEDSISIPESLMPVRDHYKVQQPSFHKVSRCTPSGVKNGSWHIDDNMPVRVQNNEQHQIESLEIDTFQESSLILLHNQDLPIEKSVRWNFPSRLAFGGHNTNPDDMMHHQKRQRKHPTSTIVKTIKQKPSLLHDTIIFSKPWSWPALTFHQLHCIAQLQTSVARNENLDPNLQSTIKPVLNSNAERSFKAQELDASMGDKGSLLAVDKLWPFPLRFPVGCFSICLGIGSQTILWKTLSTAHSMQFTHIPKHINIIVWCSAILIFFMVYTTYFVKCLFYGEAVRREFFHPVRINFFFAPWIACMLLTMGTPPAIARPINPMLWVIFMGPIFALELKIYGQWLMGGKRRLCKVANPCTHLSLLGNFVGALLAATIGWREVAIFFWAVGFAHYLVVLVTLYQRLPTAFVLPKELRPVLFMFVAAPSTASVGWSQIAGHFDMISRCCYFVALFFYISLVLRLNFFRGFRFSMTWWSYAYPVTTFANATLHYCQEVEHPFTQGLAVMFASISIITLVLLSLVTVMHLYKGTMFPNDVAIAFNIGQNEELIKPTRSKRRVHRAILPIFSSRRAKIKKMGFSRMPPNVPQHEFI
ncbi:hypothetical protein GOP47_0002023 [Adiantum capillus-veneris]|uniref:Uncharacterized protein n=1 Tax=Adiantum capillus-veneris TaxID=13818 RepID=A0A9D4VA56_ADICA|nr:hypothetical protein GOP47_0002023 [Adiantum capillus-veneris]